MAASLNPSDTLTGFFNLSATLTWDTHRPTNPVDAFIGSLQNGSLFATSITRW